MRPGTEAVGMDQIRKILGTIQKHLGGMTVTQKLLIGSLAVIMLMTLFLVTQYAGRPTMTPVWPGMGAEDQKRAAGILKNAGFVVETDSKGEAVVSAAQQLQAQAALAQAGQQPSNGELVFDNIIKLQNAFNSKEQNREIRAVMRNNWLAGVIGKFRGVQSAKVFVDAPEQVGFGATARPAKASVTIFSTSGTPLAQETVDAAAKMVAGSVAGLDLERVSVIDGTTGSPRKARVDGAWSGQGLENARQIERQLEDKLASALSFIDGVVIAVTATVDNSRQRIQTTKNLNVGEGTVAIPKRETTNSKLDTQPASGAEPGVRANTQVSIAPGGASGTRSEEKQEDTEFATGIGVEHREIDDPRGMPTRLAATITVPRGHIMGLLEREAPAPAGGAPAATPAEADIQARFDKEKVGIAEAAKVHLHAQKADGSDAAGEVVVLLASSGGWAGSGGGGGAGGGGGTMGGGTFGTIWAMGGGMIDKAVLGALAVVALGMMLMMVRKAGRRVEMPTAEELVGLPPALDARSDLVGEADETETAMPGIEVGEDEIKATKMRESVSEFIKENPDSASKLLNRWIAVEH